MAAGEGPGIRPDTPQLPGVPWVVHDGTRPLPPVVTGVSCVSVPPPADAIILFSGQNLDAWTSPDGSPSKFLLRDGAMIANGADTRTKENFGPVQVHLEWRLPAGRPVNGQAGGNSGLYLMGLYEVQILQSHDNPTYADGSAGALYGQKPPLVNATTAQGQWQSYEVVFFPPVYQEKRCVQPARVTVFHNGVLLQHDQPYLGPTGYRILASYPAEHPAEGPLQLQFHGDPVEFRNIWARKLPAAGTISSESKEK